MEAQQNKPLRYIILDTCIFQHFANESLAVQMLGILQDAKTKGYGLALSQYSLIELVDNASIENESKRMAAIKGIKHFKVKQSVLLIAGHLGCLYKEDGMEEKQQPERGDKIIGATAFLYESLIYTTNGRDYPQPFFKEIARQTFLYKTDSGRDASVVGYFIEPDKETIINKYANRTIKEKKH